MFGQLDKTDVWIIGLEFASAPAVSDAQRMLQDLVLRVKELDEGNTLRVCSLVIDGEWLQGMFKDYDLKIFPYNKDRVTSPELGQGLFLDNSVGIYLVSHKERGTGRYDFIMF